MMVTLGRNVSLFKTTHDNLIRSMDVENSPDFETALENYKATWFKTGDPYLSIALKLSKKKNTINIVRWTLSGIINMLEEIQVYDNIDTDALIIMTKCVISNQISMYKLEKAFEDFDKNHKYSCPITFKANWLNYGTYATLMYDTLYDTTLNPDDISAKTLQLMMIQDHDVDYTVLEDIYETYKSKV